MSAKKTTLKAPKKDSGVVIAYFNDESLSEFMKSFKKNLGHRQKLNIPAGTIVVMVNLTAKSVIGVCTLENWEGTTSPCREHHPLNEDVYTSKFAAYNKYDIRISNFRLLKSPVSYEDIRILVGGSKDNKNPTNMWKGFHNNYSYPFVTGDQSSIQRYSIWAKSLL